MPSRLLSGASSGIKSSEKQSRSRFFKFYPIVLEGTSEKSITEQRVGAEAFFIENYRDETLLQGFKNSWPNIKTDLAREHITINYDSLVRVSDKQLLADAKTFPSRVQEKLRHNGKHRDKIQLCSLDLDAVIERIDFFKSETTGTSFAFWAGTYFHRHNAHNCASIVLDTLYVGGMGNLLTSTQDVMGIAGLLVAAGVIVFEGSQNWQLIIAELVTGLIGGRALGGAYEGYLGVQTFLNVAASQGKDDFGTVLGLRILSLALFPIIGALKAGPLVPAFLTIPREVLLLAAQAKHEEESVNSFRVTRNPSVNF